jgi:hypothetical protein
MTHSSWVFLFSFLLQLCHMVTLCVERGQNNIKVGKNQIQSPDQCWAILDCY